jgi:hypothetical protein
MPELPAHHVVSLRDTVPISFKHPHSKATVSVKRTQLPIVPAFAITAHKAQGKTLAACVVNFTGCRGTESPYVMVSRATSLEGLVILTPFTKSKICCRQSEETRVEFRRLRYHALRTVVACGTRDEAASASLEIQASFNAPQANPGSTSASEDMGVKLHQQQCDNAVLTAPIRKARLALSSTAPGVAGSSHSGVVFLPPVSHPTGSRKRRLDDTSPFAPAKKRRQ